MKKIAGLAVVAAASDLGGGRYLVQFVLRNTVNDITGGELVATIPGASSSFDPGSVLPPEEKSRLEFNPASGILRWRFGEIFAFSGSFHDPRKLSFEISSPDQVLLREIAATGHDQFTGRTVESNKIPVLSAGGY